MAVTYKLQIHSRDVLNIGNHTGYDLVKYVNGKPTEIRSLDLTWSGLLDITINDSGWKTAVTTDTVDLSNVEIPADIAALPNVDGFGNVHDLHTAMANI